MVVAGGLANVTDAFVCVRAAVLEIKHGLLLFQDERSHVVIELVETESFYVESLQIIVKVSFLVYLNQNPEPQAKSLSKCSCCWSRRRSQFSPRAK